MERLTLGGLAKLGIAGIDLKAAFQRSGCPICRLKQEAAHRYIKGLLGENLNDVTTRVHVARSLGFCTDHSWQLYHTEMARFGDGLGTSILYEDLTRRIVQGLRDLEVQPATTPDRRHWWQRRWARLRAIVGYPSLAAPHLGGLLPQEPCPVCTHAAESEIRDLHLLIEGCADPTFRDWYAASEGLCLPHLRQTLAQAAQADPDVARFLAATAAGRLQVLITDLGEYIRKHAWKYHEEPLTNGEKDSPRRASQFFAGPPGEEEG